MQSSFLDALDARLPLGKSRSIRLADVLCMMLLTGLGLFVRLVLFDHISGDYRQFLSLWYDDLAAAGGLPGIGHSIGDYTPLYIYLMALLTYLPMKSLYAIKLLSCLFDFGLAILVGRAVYRKKRTISSALCGYAVVLFFPTVVLNGAYWAQCDGIFTFFLLLSLLLLEQNHPVGGVTTFAVAFCLKLQAIFFAPVLLLCWLGGRMKFRHFFLIPGIYFLSILPAWIAGRPLSELLTIYFSQTQTYKKISMNAPNLYIFIENDQSSALTGAAIFLCAAAVLLSLYLLYIKRERINGETLWNAALYFAILIPFLLPRMHERYFYPADLLAVMYAFSRPKRAVLPLLVGGASLASYMPFLFGCEPLDLRIAAVLMGAALWITASDLFGAFGNAEEDPAE